MASPEQEAMARQNGFPSYDAMLVWAQQRNIKRDVQTISGAGAPPSQAPAVPAQGSDPRYQGVAGMFRYIGDALKGRTGK